jgi:hypothetical protein
MNDARRTLQPSASKTGLLLECAYPFDKIIATTGPGDRESADYGLAFHELIAWSIENDWASPSTRRIAETAARWGLDDSAKDEELAPHIAEAAGILRRWLAGANPFKINFLEGKTHTEISYALGPRGARRIAPPTVDEHIYEDLRSGEIAGTADLMIEPARRSTPWLVLDHKTGQSDFSEPLKIPQLLTLAACVEARNVIVAVLHARRRGMTAVYGDHVPKEMLTEHCRKVFGQLARIGDGSMRPGTWCLSERCPAAAAGVCPARDAELLEKAGHVLTGLVEWVDPDKSSMERRVFGSSRMTRPQKLGMLYTVVQQAEKLAVAARREIRTEVAAGALPELPSASGGGYLTIRKYERETLSKASYVRAYGAAAAERAFQKLRRDGAIETTTVEALHIEKERGS